MKEIIKHYQTDEINVKWQPKLCSHSGICAAGLPRVFNPKNKPWINITAEDAEAIKKQVQMCPSGALSLEE